ncbi:MAG TPA: AAA family ATPase [Methanocorpusculum sp.]|nr:AAA family ATPase [Methanocorpusculum sp.]
MLKIELSDLLFKLLIQADSEFTACIENGDMEGAKQKAGELAKIYRHLSNRKKEMFSTYRSRANLLDAFSRGESPLEDTIAGSKSEETTADSGEPEDLRKTADTLISTPIGGWRRIGGMHSLKKELMESIVFEGLANPQSFNPGKGILLYGPPGNGKTMFAAAVAESLKASFYNLRSETIVPQYHEHSANLITELYASAQEHAPSLIFFDDIMALIQVPEKIKREPSHKAVSGLLKELDGLDGKTSDRILLTIASTSLPWNLSRETLARFPRRIYVPPPNFEDVQGIIKKQSKGLDISGVHLKHIAGKCVWMRYSGRNVSDMCHQIISRMIQEENPGLYNKLLDMPFRELKSFKIKTRTLRDDDFLTGLKSIKSSLTRDMIERYEQWGKENGDT